MTPSATNNFSPEILSLLRASAKTCATKALRQVWLSNSSAIDAMLPALIEAHAKSALADDGDFLGAYDLAGEGIRLAQDIGFPTQDLVLVRATALARSGSPMRARNLLDQLVASGEAHAIAHGSMARTFRDVARASTDEHEKRRLFLEAAECSQRGFQSTTAEGPLSALVDRAYLAGQIAQFTKLGGDDKRSKWFQDEVIRCCEAVDTLVPDPEISFWLETNRAEMALLRGDMERAELHYTSMRRLGAKMMSSVAANADVCRMLLQELGHKPDRLNACFRLAPVVVFSGHMFDSPNRPKPRFPEHDAEALKASIRRVLDEHDITEGFSSASAGADLLFSEALLERGGRLHLVLPFSTAETRKISIEPFGIDWTNRFDKLVKQASSISNVESSPIEANDHSSNYQHTNRIMVGFCILAAIRKRLMVQPLLVWDQSDRDHPLAGGTGDMFRFLCSLGHLPWALSPASHGRIVIPKPPKDSAWRPQEDSDGHRKVRTFLFADLKGFSSISEQMMRGFVLNFLKTAADILRAPESGVILCNTWGDALYAVFESVERAAETALNLRDRVANTLAEEKASEDEVSDSRFNLRISLHAGPVYVGHDPVINDECYIGSHVVRTARMEPIAEVGQVIVSEEFAALVATSPAQERFAFHYLGLARLPKGYGRMPSYELEWRYS